jgi:MoxR-like ATPase
LNLEEVIQLQQSAADVFVHPEIIQAVTHIVRQTRQTEGIALGASTRSGIIFLKCLRAYALVKGRTFVLEDDVLDIAFSVLDHRLIYRNKESKQQALATIIKKEMERLMKLKLIHG